MKEMFKLSGDRLRAVRESRRLTQDDVGKKLKTARQTINSWESKPATKIALSKALILAGFLQVSLDDLTFVNKKIDNDSDLITLLKNGYRLVSLEQMENDRIRLEKERLQLEIDKQRMINDSVRDRQWIDYINKMDQKQQST